MYIIRICLFLQMAKGPNPDTLYVLLFFVFQNCQVSSFEKLQNNHAPLITMYILIIQIRQSPSSQKSDRKALKW